MDKPTEKSFDFAASVSKQLISLSTAVIAIMLTFGKNLLGENMGTEFNCWLIAAWLLFLVSTVCGIATLMALAGSLAKFQEPDNNPVQPPFDEQQANGEGQAGGVDNNANPNLSSIYGKNVTIPSTIQILTFVLALISAGIYGCLIMTSQNNTPVPKVSVEKNLKVLRHSTYNFIDSVKTDTVYVVE